jgi:hypothetical protein
MTTNDIVCNPQLITHQFSPPVHCGLTDSEILVDMNYSYVNLKKIELYRKTILQPINQFLNSKERDFLTN